MTKRKNHKQKRIESSNDMIGPYKKEDILPVMTKDNYKEYYEQWKVLQNLKDYKGKRTYTPITSGKSNVAGDTRYAMYNAIKDAEDNIMEDADPSKETVEQFLTRAKFKSFGGSSTQEHLTIHDRIMKTYKPKIIVEIGFNTGLSADNFLKNPDVELVVSFDILMRFYSNYAKWYLDKKYPGRHILVAGDSSVTVPTFSKAMKGFKADLLFHDGSHLLNPAYEDLRNLFQYAREDTILIVDNVVPHRGVGVSVYDALLRAIDEGFVNFIDHVETGDYKDGFAICKYNVRPEDKFKTGKIDYVYVERRIECYYYTYLVQEVTNKEELIKLKDEIETAIRDRPESFDMYVILEINKKMKEFGDYDNMSIFRKRGKVWSF